MLWFIGIASVWTLGCVMAVALCVMARRGDDALTLGATVEPAVAELPADVAWVATIAAPEVATPAAPVAQPARVSI